MNYGCIRQVGIENFVPTHHALVIPGDNLKQAFAEIGLQGGGVRHFVLIHERANVRRAKPFLRTYFVAADVEVFVRKQ